MSDYSKDSITVNMVVKTHSKKYRTPMTGKDTGGIDEFISGETSLDLIQKLIASGDFTAEYIPASFTTTSTGVLIIEEKV